MLGVLPLVRTCTVGERRRGCENLQEVFKSVSAALGFGPICLLHGGYWWLTENHGPCVIDRVFSQVLVSWGLKLLGLLYVNASKP
jgi:hypothetical protein